jgi:hypothetical protein
VGRAEAAGPKLEGEGAVVVVAVVAVDGEERHTMRTEPSSANALRALIIALLALARVDAAGAEPHVQRVFAHAADAVRALVGAAGSSNRAAVLAILGPGSEEVISSGDPVDDRAAGRHFAAKAEERTRLETLDSGAVIVHIGKDDWPFAIPLVKEGNEWRFDTPAGRDELLNRRIGRNELKAIDVCRVYVEAQREYANREGSREGGLVYARKVRSDPGKRDGLYWDDPTGAHPSPLGPLLAEAAAEGYTKPEADAAPRPYHGYFYRILTAQGPHAPGGARSYLDDGRMTGGFALLAYPAEHRSSGVMTLVVGPPGIVYQKNLGDATAEVAKAITAYDPDESWTPVRD